jgi:uncharacterized protein YciI
MFVISLNYVVPLEQIDGAMKDHMTFLNRYYAEGVFVASGRKVPRTGGIILASGKSREEIEKIMNEDPFVARGLSEYTIIEFMTSQVQPALKKFLK